MSFRHEALLYRGEDEFLDVVVPPLREAVQAGGAALIAVDRERSACVRDALGADAQRVAFADMRVLGANPGRIIPLWRNFVADHAGGDLPVVGIGEPVWPGRAADELVECERHECLLNTAFADGPSWWLGCPYDAVNLDAETLDCARRSHPVVVEKGVRAASAVHDHEAPLPGEPLTPVPEGATELRFTREDLPALRTAVSACTAGSGLSAPRAADVLVAVNELATNSVRHGGGSGVLRAWSNPDAVHFEVSDAGHIGDPLIGRAYPSRQQLGGRGVWLVHQLCDLVQLRSSPQGTVVRVRMGIA